MNTTAEYGFMVAEFFRSLTPGGQMTQKTRGASDRAEAQDTTRSKLIRGILSVMTATMSAVASATPSFSNLQPS